MILRLWGNKNNFMKIISLKSENVKRLQAVEITPEGRLVLYHGTQSGEAIMESGYLKAHSYLATTPEVAKRFGMAAGGRRNIQVIRVEVDPGKGFLHGDGYFSANEPIDIRGKGTEYVQDRV